LSAYLTAAEAEQIYATKESLTQSINDLINGAPEALDTLKEISDALEGNNN
jgi:ClpP class serine protease